MPTHTQMRCLPWASLSLSALPHHLISESEVECKHSWSRDQLEATWKPRGLKYGVCWHQSKMAFPTHAPYFRRLCLLYSRDEDSCNSINKASALTGHQGHCLLIQPGQEPSCLHKGVHSSAAFIPVYPISLTNSTLSIILPFGKFYTLGRCCQWHLLVSSPDAIGELEMLTCGWS